MNDYKAQPHSDEAEAALLAAMVERNSLINDLDFLAAEDFYRAENQAIYSEIQKLAFTGKPVDAVTLCESLEASNMMDSAGGLDYVLELLTQSRGPSNAPSYANIVRDKSKSRQLIQAGYQITELGFSESESSEKIDQAQSVVMGISYETAQEPRHINAIMREVVEEVDRRFNDKREIIGLETGFNDLDKATAGLQDGQLIIIAGRPAMGKTTLAMNIAENAAMQGKFVIVFNLEMTDQNLVMKLTSSVGRLDYSRLKRGTLLEEDWPKLNMAASRIKDQTLYIDDNASLTSGQILSRVRKLENKMQRKPDLIVVDYLQLLNDKGDGHERITKISRALKMTAKTVRCPVIALSQLSRGVDARPNKRPLMSDLRESGAIEQDADIILFVYRDEVYNEHSQDKGIAELIMAKARDDEAGTIRLSSQLNICRFDNLSHPYVERPQEQPKKAFSSLDRGR